MAKFGIRQFNKKFLNDKACLEYLKELTYPDSTKCPKCERESNFYKVNGRKAYACQFCGHHVYPTAGTIFDKSATPLKLWFYAMFIMSVTRSGVSAKQLERELGVTYKTAWRIFHSIRRLMNEPGGKKLKGIVEVDETFVGGKGKNRRRVSFETEEKKKEVVMGMVERKGKAYLKHVPNTGKWTLINQVRENVDPKARVMSDEYPAYISLPQYGYRHDSVDHKSTMVDSDIHTQNIENVWSHLKRGIYGVYRHVSAKHLQAYADEYAFRYNYRDENMFDLLLKNVTEVRMVRGQTL